MPDKFYSPIDIGNGIAVFQLSSEFRHGKGTLASQLAAQIRQAIEAGELLPGDRLPATRGLASDLGVSRGTVTTAFELLVAEGLLETRTGSGTFISPDAIVIVEDCMDLIPNAAPEPRSFPTPDVDGARPALVDFRPCRPSTVEFPLKSWRRCLSIAASAIPGTDYGDSRGNGLLREEIVQYLRRARGMRTNADQIIITNGAVHAMYLLASAYLGKGDTVVFEDPGYPLARQTFELSGAKIHLSRVDHHGLDLDTLPRRGDSVRFVYVTPSHQFPTGSRLSLGRRRALLNWAAERGALVIEDDYDGEFRYDVPLLAPMATMAPSMVIYCGTFSKTMFPGLRIGYAVADKSIVDTIASYRTLTEYAPCAITQSALRHFISSGAFERHVHKMRRVYRQKRRAVQTALSNQRTGTRLTGTESGLNALIEVDKSTSAESLSHQASANGILVPTLSRYSPKQNARFNSLVLGYAAPSLLEIKAGIDQLFDAAVGR